MISTLNKENMVLNKIDEFLNKEGFNLIKKGDKTALKNIRIWKNTFLLGMKNMQDLNLKRQINIGLGKGKALETFNENIVKFEIVK